MNYNESSQRSQPLLSSSVAATIPEQQQSSDQQQHEGQQVVAVPVIIEELSTFSSIGVNTNTNNNNMMNNNNMNDNHHQPFHQDNLSNPTDHHQHQHQQETIVVGRRQRRRQAEEQEEEQFQQLIFLRKLLGRPYSSKREFWFFSLPSCIVFGIVLSLLSITCWKVVTVSFHGVFDLYNKHLCNSNSDDDATTSTALFTAISRKFVTFINDDSDDESDAAASSDCAITDFTWIIITTLGGFVSGIFFLLSNCSSPSWPCDTQERLPKAFFHDVIYLKISNTPMQSFLFIISGLVAIASGAPVGPEIVFGAIGTGFVSLLVYLFDVKNRRLVAWWIHASIVGVFTLFFPSPLLCVLLMHELIVSGRSDSLAVDLTLMNHNNDYDENEQGHHQQEHGGEQQHQRQVRQQRPQHEMKRSTRHDNMEMILLCGATAIMASITQNVFQKSFPEWFTAPTSTTTTATSTGHSDGGNTIIPCCFFGDGIIHYNSYPEQYANELITIDNSNNSTNASSSQFEISHFMTAIPLGFIGGLIGTLVLTMIGICYIIRIKMYRIIESGTCCSWITKIFFPTFAGAIHGFLTVFVNKMMVQAYSDTIIYYYEDYDSLDDQDGEGPQMALLLLMIFSKVISLSVCLGFGLVGGVIFPLACIGLNLGHIIHYGLTTMTHFTSVDDIAPLSLIISCCICGSIGSFLPTPFTLIFTVWYFIFGGATTSTMNNLGGSTTADFTSCIGPMFVATFVAHATCGAGVGIFDAFAKRFLIGSNNWRLRQFRGSFYDDTYNHRQHQQYQQQVEEENQDGEEESSLLLSDSQIIEDIRTTLFGTSSPYYT